LTDPIEKSSFRLEPAGSSPVAEWRNLFRQISRLRCTPLEMTTPEEAVTYIDFYKINYTSAGRSK